MKKSTNIKPKDNAELPRLHAKKTIQQEQAAETLKHIAKVPQREDRKAEHDADTPKQL